MVRKADPTEVAARPFRNGSLLTPTYYGAWVFSHCPSDKYCNKADHRKAGVGAKRVNPCCITLRTIKKGIARFSGEKALVAAAVFVYTVIITT